MADYPDIKSLDFSDNLLRNVKDLQRVQKSLIALNVSNNKIDFRDVDFAENSLASITQLIELDLSNNMI